MKSLGQYIAPAFSTDSPRIRVGEAIMFGSQYAMRVWMNPDN